MRLFFTLATALMASAGMTGCQTASFSNLSTVPTTAVVAPSDAKGCDAKGCDANAGCDSAAGCASEGGKADCGCSGGTGCNSADCAGGCTDGSCGTAGVAVATPVRNLAARVRANAGTTACADGSCDASGNAGCPDGSCGTGSGSAIGAGNGGLFGGLFRRPGLMGASGQNASYAGGAGFGNAAGGMGRGGMGAGGMGAGGMGPGGMGPGGMGAGGMGPGGMGAGGMGHGGIVGGGLGHGGLGHGGIGHGGLGGGAGRLGSNVEHPYGGMPPHTPQMSGPFGPMSPSYGYPYYTTRGPRDFFMDNPPSLGR
jgi:hypothetical protein